MEVPVNSNQEITIEIGSNGGGVTEIFYVNATSSNFPNDITVSTPYADALSAFQGGKNVVLKLTAGTDVYLFNVECVKNGTFYFYSKKVG